MPAALYYIHDPLAPEPNRPSRFGAAAVLYAEGKVLLEHRRDTYKWGIVSSDIKDTESFKDCAVRSILSETGIAVAADALHELQLFDDPSRIVSFSEGNIYRIVHFSYYVLFDRIPATVCGSGSLELRWVDPADLDDYEIVVTHQDILEAFFRERHICHTMHTYSQEEQ